MRCILAIVLSCCCLVAQAQSGLERQVSNRTEKGKWKSAEDLLRKEIRKDTLNPEARYVLSRLFFTPGNPAFNIDSSYRSVMLAIRDFSASTPKDKERLKRVVDSTRLIAQRKRIDSAAFERAKEINSEKSYQDFISGFSFAAQQHAAVELRNEVAFVDALKINTYQAFQDYLTRYPASQRAAEARQRYDKLLYVDHTRDGTLKSYEAFYQDHPESPFRIEAERNLFEIITASGKPSTIAAFISKYPTSVYRLKAESILFHLVKDEEERSVDFILSDSLKKVQAADQGYWVPILRSGKFGFINHLGTETIAPQFDNLRPEYLCGNIKSDYLVMNEGIISRGGQWIVRTPVVEALDLGAGFLKVNTGKCIQAVHKSGFHVTDSCFEDIKLTGRNFIAVRKNLKWGLLSLAGKQLIDPGFDDIREEDDLVILEHTGKKVIVTIDEVAGLAERKPMNMGRVYDDVQRLATGFYRVRNGSLEGILNSSLEFEVPLDRQTVSKVPVGFLLKRDQRNLLVGVDDKLVNREFRTIQFYGRWIRLEEGSRLQLYDLKSKRMTGSSLDSLWFDNELAFARKNDSLHVYLKSGTRLNFVSETRVTFIKSADSTDYFFTPEKNKKNVFDTDTGKRLFSYDFDGIEYLGEDVFLVSVGSKKGLLSPSGKVLLQVEYAAVVPAGQGIVSLLKDKKFGLFQLKTRKLLKPVYDRNVIVVSKQQLVAFREGGYGFINWESKPLSRFEFEEIQPWNDTSVWVKKDFQWMIFKTGSKQTTFNKVRDYRFVFDGPSEKIAIVHQDIHYGVLSNRRGEILPPNFSDIINVGSEEEPMYFAEKNVEEAGIYVVIYYDQNGKLLRKQVYEEDEYERIFCAEN